MSFSLHHAFMPHSLPDQKTQNEKVMNRNFPILEYPETLSLKYCLGLVNPWELKIHRTSTMDVSPLGWQSCLSSCCFLLEGVLDLHRLSAVQKPVGWCPKQWVNRVPQKVETRQQQFLCHSLSNFTILYFKFLFPSKNTSEKEFKHGNKTKTLIP